MHWYKNGKVKMLNPKNHSINNVPQLNYVPKDVELNPKEQALKVVQKMKNLRYNFEQQYDKTEKAWVQIILEIGDYEEVYKFCKRNISEMSKFNYIMQLVRNHINNATQNQSIIINSKDIEQIQIRANAVVEKMKLMKKFFYDEYLFLQKELALNTARIGDYQEIYGLGLKNSLNLSQFCQVMNPTREMFLTLNSDFQSLSLNTNR